MNLTQALTLSARGLDAQTDRLRGMAGPASDPAGCRPRYGPYQAGWPDEANLRELQATRALLSRLVSMLA